MAMTARATVSPDRENRADMKLGFLESLLERSPSVFVARMEGECHHPTGLQRLASVGECAAQSDCKLADWVIADRIDRRRRQGLSFEVFSEPCSVEERQIGVRDEVEVRRVGKNEVE